MIEGSGLIGSIRCSVVVSHIVLVLDRNGARVIGVMVL
jgi:hypothetical protein